MAFDTSPLSQENILRDVHDPVTQTLRTTASATIIVPGGLEVDIDQASDSIKLGDGTTLFTSTTVGPKTGLDVSIISGNLQGEVDAYPLEKGLTRNTYNEVLAVASGVETTIVTYTVPSGRIAYLSRTEYSGTNIATYAVKINGTTQDKKRTNYATSLNESTILNSSGNTGIALVAGDVVTVTATHTNASTGDFNSRVETVEIIL